MWAVLLPLSSGSSQCGQLTYLSDREKLSPQYFLPLENRFFFLFL